ncbi:hypothetical protein NPIL_408551 [Nephila pilipes]|uniref:Uncharacterized protein n=1 Tax=Nephila pilipes TaxID=299642 RepID=A0A8X6JT99_NEPPI|nr:hypothetical protein NPIL_408551 [Nephila pilipes]
MRCQALQKFFKLSDKYVMEKVSGGHKKTVQFLATGHGQFREGGWGAASIQMYTTISATVGIYVKKFLEKKLELPDLSKRMSNRSFVKATTVRLKVYNVGVFSISTSHKTNDENRSQCTKHKRAVSGEI